MTDYDSPWKEAPALYFREFMEFYFPTAHDDIDWARGYETLDKELQKIIRAAESGRRFADHLIKVWRKNGQEEWLLIHVEIQTQADLDFATRLYIYNYRIFDRYQRDVVTLVLLADERENWRPDHYEFSRWGFRVRMDFPTLKLLDVVRSRGDLEADPNPFAALTLAHVRTLETKGDPDLRRAWKFRLVKSLYQRGLSPEDVREFFRCIDWMMDLPKEMEELFWDDLNRFEKENKMPFVDIATRKGMEKGMEKGIIESILLDWEHKFGAVAEDDKNELHAITDLDLLRRILRAGKAAGSLDELRKMWKAT